MLKLIRKARGEYTTKDGRFVIRDGYDPSGPAHVREGRQSSIRWECYDTHTKRSHFDFTLARCRERIENCFSK